MKIREVPFQALGGEFGKDDVKAALNVMEAAAKPGGSFFPLPEESDFQNALAEHEGCSYAIVVNSCGTALDLCMYVLGIGKGDEVIVPGQTFVCTATCAAARGAKVVFADIEADTMCLAPQAVEKKITERTKAIIPVHFAGLAADVEGFEQISQKYNIPIIYDAAHAISTKWKGQSIGQFGFASCYSFQSNKNMTTLGEGGAIVTNDAEFAEKVRQAKTFGYVYGKELRVVSIGFNYRMTKVQAAVGLSQLAKVDKVIANRRQRFLRLIEQLKDVEEITVPSGIDTNHSCHLFVIQLSLEKLKCSRDEFRKILKDKYQVGTALHYPAIWSWDVANKFEYDNSDCANTEKVCSSVISLPVFANSSDADIDYLAWAIKETINRC